MTDTNMPIMADSDDFDDLPRTFRRERERQAAEASSISKSTASASFEIPRDDYQGNFDHEPAPAKVERFNVPFLHLMLFLMKAVVAAIPALLLLAVILWFAGQALQAFFPELVQLKILISFPAESAN